MAPSEDGRLPQGFAPELLPAIEAGFWKTFFGWFKPQKPDDPPWNEHTVDGRNPKQPPGMVKTLLNNAK